jgi:hypothetical protein
MITVVNMIPNSLSGESEQDSEPNIAVNPANPQQIAASAFTPDPMGGANAPIYVSIDGGNSWSLNFIVPSQIQTADITLGFGETTNTLYAAILRLPFNSPNPRMAILRTKNFQGPSIMTVLVDRTGAGVDQPFLDATTVRNGSDTGRDRLYVGNNDFNAESGRTATIDRSLSAAAGGAFRSVRIEARGTGSAGQNGPQIRPVVHADGTVYAVFYGWRSFSTLQEVTADVVVVRDDNWGRGTNPFRALTDPADSLPGRMVARGVKFRWNQMMGQQRTGGNVSIAADPRNSTTVYLSWADRQNNVYTLHLRRSDDRGVTWSAQDLRTVPSGTNGAVAVNSDGHVGFLYQQLEGTGASQRWVTHLERSADGINWTDLILARVPASTPPKLFDPYIGDYADLQAVGRDFYGIFSANNTPDMANFPNGVRYLRNADFTSKRLLALDGTTPVDVSIDPFFFKVTP